MSMWMILRTNASNYTIRGCATSRVRSVLRAEVDARGVSASRRELPLFRFGHRSCYRDLTPAFPKTAGGNTDSGLFGDALGARRWRQSSTFADFTKFLACSVGVA